MCLCGCVWPVHTSRRLSINCINKVERYDIGWSRNRLRRYLLSVIGLAIGKVYWLVVGLRWLCRLCWSIENSSKHCSRGCCFHRIAAEQLTQRARAKVNQDRVVITEGWW